MTELFSGIVPNSFVATVQAADYDEDDSYSDVKKTYDTVTVSQIGGKDYEMAYLYEDKTNVHPIQVEKKTDYVIGMSARSYGECSILVLNAKEKTIYEKKLDLEFEKWKKTLTLSKGNYYIKVLSKCYNLQYELSVQPKVKILKETQKLKMYSCDTTTLSPELGKGTWTTSDKSIVTLTSKKAKNVSSCKIRTKKAGTATVTYKNSSGSVIKYKITVSKKDTYPVYDAYITMNSVGGLKPVIYISNYSSKKIKYVYLDVSFYNAVADKVTNSIGGYSSASLKITGPIKAWNTEWFSWDPVFYNTTATKMKIGSVKIIYMDGTTKTVDVNKKYSIYE
jgi:hypothetical protein